MFIRIFQPNPILAGKVATSFHLDEGHLALESDQYDLVYAGNFEPKDTHLSLAENLFRQFSAENAPKDFFGHPLATGDVVEIQNTDTVVNGCYVVECVGGMARASMSLRSQLNHDEANNKTGMVTGVLCEQGKVAKVHTIFALKPHILHMLDCTHYMTLSLVRESLRDKARPGSLVVLCREKAFDGNQLPDKNRALRNNDGYPYANVTGDFFICRIGTHGLQSLTPAECKEMVEKYYLPEYFFSFNGEVQSVAYYPEENA